MPANVQSAATPATGFTVITHTVAITANRMAAYRKCLTVKRPNSKLATVPFLFALIRFALMYWDTRIRYSLPQHFYTILHASSRTIARVASREGFLCHRASNALQKPDPAISLVLLGL
ncbi:hypothetical protein [Stutzerimonas chloritidismutans]